MRKSYNRDVDNEISAADAKHKFPQLLRRVRSGLSFVVTSQGKPIARITPIEQDREKAKAALLARLENQPIRNVGRWKREDLYD
jgi:prevent-host-death family protein